MQSTDIAPGKGRSLRSVVAEKLELEASFLLPRQPCQRPHQVVRVPTDTGASGNHGSDVDGNLHGIAGEASRPVLVAWT